MTPSSLNETPESPPKKNVFGHLVEGVSMIPIIGDAASLILLLAPGLVAGIGYQLAMGSWAVSQGVDADVVTGPFLTWFPDRPRISLTLMAGSGVVFGVVCLFWTKLVRLSGARPKVIWIPWGWWSRGFLAAAVVVAICGLIAPEATLATLERLGADE